jgi:hypothetical protein
MFRDKPVPLADDSAGCALEERIRRIQNGSEVYQISLNQGYLQQLNLWEQGAPTKHSVALRPVTIERPAYIVQPAEVLEE